MLLVLAVGCGDAAKDGASSAKPDSSAKADKGEKADKSDKAPKPVAAKGDPVILEAAKKVATGCEWDEGEPKSGCEAEKAWDDLKALEDGAGDATLVSLINDPDEKLQYVGAAALSGKGKKFEEDKALAVAVLDRLETGVGTPQILAELADAAGDIDGEKTGLSDRLKELPKKLKDKSARAEFLGGALFNNKSLYDATLDAAKNDPDPDVRYAAVGAFWTGTPNDKIDEVCQMYADTAKDAKAESRLQSQAAYLAMFTSRACKLQYDGLLKLIEEKSKTKLESNSWVMPIYFFVTNSSASEEQRKEGVRIMKAIAEDTKHSGGARTQALEGVAKGDPTTAKAYLAKFKSDKDEWVKTRAEEALKRIAEDEKKKK